VEEPEREGEGEEMNRRGFIGLLLSAPIAVVVALKAKPLVLGNGSETPNYDAFFEKAWTNGTRWSDATSSPIAEIEAGMKKIRAGVVCPPRMAWVYVSPSLGWRP
jgi:hypothetical protein